MNSRMSRDSSVPPSSFFSSVHAPNIQLDDSGTKVSRNSGTYNGLAFSYQQIEIGERVSVALELNHDYDGDLRIGVTTNDPANINQLPKYSCPMLCGKVGYWLAAIPASNGVENNSRITFYLTNNGSFQLFVNGNHKGAILTNLPTKDSLWIVFDLFGRTVSLTLIKEDHVPVEIVSRGQAAVEAYRKTLSSGCIPIYRTRLMIVGPKGSGKTTLKNLLVKPLKIDSNESMVNKNFVIDTFTKFMIGESRESSNIPQWQKLGRNDSPETSKNRNSKYQEESSESFVLEYEKNLEEEYHKAISKNIVRELLQQKKLIEDKKRNSAGKARQLHFNKKTLSWKRSKQDGKKFYDKKEIDCKVNAFELPDQICDMVEKLLQEAEMKQDWDKIETEKQSVNCVFCPSQVEVNLWDWSGDPDNFIIQQPFFSSKAVYLVVFDISKSLDFPDQPNQNCNDLQSSYLSQIQFWLQSIYNHASTSFYQPHLPPNKQENSSPAFIPNIVLIGTHKNQLHADCAVRDKIADSKFHRIKESIQEKAYKECIMGKMFALDICDSYCSLSDSIRNIQSCLETVIQSQWHMGKQIPLKYLAFEQSINKLVETKTNCADLGTLQTIAESDGIMGEEGLKIMLQYFYTFGTLLFFDSVIGSADEDLRNIVVLSPHWLMESFRACLYPPTTSESGIQLLESEGKLLPSALFNVVPDIQYNVPVILGLLEKFELICDTSCNINIKESEKTYLVPLRAKATVDDSKREAQPNETNAVEFYFKFTGFVFDSVFTRLLTRTIKWCYCNSNNGGKYLKFSKYLLRFDFDDQHDVKMQLIFHDRIKVTVIRMEKISSSGVFKTESETQRVNSQKKPIPEVCAMVRHFLESSLEDIRVMWEKRMVFQSSVVCWCSKDCNLHNRKSCTDEKCQHFLALDECLIKKVVYCDNQRLKTSEVQSWFPEITYNSRRFNLKSYNMFGSNESHYQKWDIENSDNTSLPSWTSCAAKFLNAGSEGQDWSALAVKLGYKEKKIGEFQDSMSPAQALIADWIHSSGNTKLSTDMMLSCLEEMHCTEIIDIMKESIVEKDPPPVFLSYQWDIQEDALLIRNQLEAHGFSCWMDVGQMGGGDLLYQQIYEGINSCKVMVCCISPKYVVSNTCSREVSLADGLNKPMVPVMIKHTTWPPPGAMGLIFSQLVYVSMCQNGGHGGSGKHCDWQTRTQEIILQVSRYISPPLHNNESFVKISKSGARKDVQFHVEEINGISNSNTDSTIPSSPENSQSINGYNNSARQFRSPVNVSNCTVCSIL